MNLSSRFGLGRALQPARGPATGHLLWEVLAMSIVRIGLAETKNFKEGYASIFGGKKKKDDETPQPKAKKKTAKAAKKKAKK
jgi:hypothetical protein